MRPVKTQQGKRGGVLRSCLLSTLMTVFLVGCNGNMPDMKTARLAYQEEDYQTAISHYQQLAEFGVPRARTELGKLYLYGKGTERDPARALQLFQEAEAAGETKYAPRYIPRAQARLVATGASETTDMAANE